MGFKQVFRNLKAMLGGREARSGGGERFCRPQHALPSKKWRRKVSPTPPWHLVKFLTLSVSKGRYMLRNTRTNKEQLTTARK